MSISLAFSPKRSYTPLCKQGHIQLNTFNPAIYTKITWWLPLTTPGQIKRACWRVRMVPIRHSVDQTVQTKLGSLRSFCTKLIGCGTIPQRTFCGTWMPRGRMRHRLHPCSEGYSPLSPLTGGGVCPESPQSSPCTVLSTTSSLIQSFPSKQIHFIVWKQLKMVGSSNEKGEWQSLEILLRYHAPRISQSFPSI